RRRTSAASAPPASPPSPTLLSPRPSPGSTRAAGSSSGWSRPTRGGGPRRSGALRDAPRSPRCLRAGRMRCVYIRLMDTLIALLVALALAAVHLFAGRLRFLDTVPRAAWLSGAGGASVAYVFLHLLPELAAGQEAIADAAPLAFLETHVWMVALL